MPGQALAVNAVSVGDNFFSPQSIAVNAGEAVEWKNDGNLPHTVTSDTGTFDSGLVMKTNAFSQTFEVAGTFTYYCAVHPEMVGTVVVEAPVQPTPEPTAAPADPGPAPAQPAAPNPATADVDVVSRWVVQLDGIFKGRVCMAQDFIDDHVLQREVIAATRGGGTGERQHRDLSVGEPPLAYPGLL